MDTSRFHYHIAKAGLPVIGVSSDGRIDYSRELTVEEKVIERTAIQSYDDTLPTPSEINEAESLQAEADFPSLPDWVHWKPSMGKEYVHYQILSGKTKEEVSAQIDTDVTTLATAKVALKLLATAIIDIRNVIAEMAWAILLLRDVTRIGK